MNPKPSFTDLDAAIEFAARALDARDCGIVADACVADQPDAVGLPTRREYRVRAIESLAARHAASSLRSRYAGRTFPANEATFELGGHESELGHVHVDFVRGEDGWQFKEIWICR
jgi:hypothetical protein